MSDLTFYALIALLLAIGAAAILAGVLSFRKNGYSKGQQDELFFWRLATNEQLNNSWPQISGQVPGNLFINFYSQPSLAVEAGKVFTEAQ